MPVTAGELDAAGDRLVNDVTLDGEVVETDAALLESGSPVSPAEPAPTRTRMSAMVS